MILLKPGILWKSGYKYSGVAAAVPESGEPLNRNYRADVLV
jgi:hypothetical protein